MTLLVVFLALIGALFGLPLFLVLAVIALASRGKPRGYLITSTGRPHSPSSLSRITHLPAKDFDKVIPLCIACGLLQEVPNPHRPPVSPTPPRRHMDVTSCPPGAPPNEREGTEEGKDERIEPASTNGAARVRGGVTFSDLVHRVVEARRRPEKRGEDLAFLMRLWDTHVWPAAATTVEGERELSRFAELAENAIKRGRDPIRYIQGVMTKRGKP